MQIRGFHAAAPNLCSVCVDRAAGGEYQGRLYHYYTDRGVPFRTRFELISAIDRLCDLLGYPQAAQQPRRFGRAQPLPQQREVERLMGKDELAGQKGRMATFVVHVMHRQNATWQGTVVWAEKDQKASFRSALELIKLMDSAVEESLPIPESPWGSAGGEPTSSDNHDSIVQE